jgi:iron(III) transport system ATP-binding protein
VARFTGLAGELPVRIRDGGSNGTMLVEPRAGSGSVPFHVRAPLGPLAAGDATVMIRPTGVRLCADGADGHHLSGRVTDVAFRGRGYEHAIDVDGSIRLTGVFADVRAARGQAVGLRLDPAGCHLFAADP